MKKIGFALVVLFLTSCGNSIKKRGEITLKNGQDKDVSVSYSISNEVDFINEKYTEKEFRHIIEITSIWANTQCVNEATYEPIKSSVTILPEDTVMVTVKGSCENNFGAKGDISNHEMFIGTEKIKSRFKSY